MRWARLIVVAGCRFIPAPLTDDGAVGDASLGDAPSLDAAADAAPSDLARRKVIAIGPVGESIAGFPVWITISGDKDLQGGARADGADLYFSLPGGTPLEWERRAWDKTKGNLDAWVRVDLAPAGTSIELRYGDPAVAHAPAPPLVFANQFTAVWHLDDDTPATTIVDTLGVRAGTPAGNLASVKGQLGQAIKLDGAAATEITFTSPFAANDAHTISAWVNAAAPAKGFSTILSAGDPATNSARFIHTRYDSGIGYGFFGNDHLDGPNVDGQMHLVHWVFAKAGSSGTSTIYVDGIPGAPFVHNAGTIATSGAQGHLGSSPMQFGPGGTTVNALKGVLDEVRIANVDRDAAWVAAEYANQHAPASFYAVGSAQSVP